jgi:hypothetical protein
MMRSTRMTLALNTNLLSDVWDCAIASTAGSMKSSKIIANTSTESKQNHESWKQLCAFL